MSIEDEIKKMMQESIDSYEEPFLPKSLNDERLEDAFKTPEYDEQGYAPGMPCIHNSSSYGETDEGIKILSLKSAFIASSLYSKYLDEEAIVWDAAKQELFIYVPDKKCPTVAFKGDRWLCAKRLKPEYQFSTNYLYDVYFDLLSKIKEELGQL